MLKNKKKKKRPIFLKKIQNKHLFLHVDVFLQCINIFSHNKNP